MTDLLSSAATITVPATVAAVLPEELGECFQRSKICGVQRQAALSTRLDQLARDEPIQVVVERRPGDLELFLELGRRDAIAARLNDGSQDGKPRSMAECTELSGVVFESLHIY
jgi:hypothetical protein